jgi:Ni/Co efflux regulator RcnB
MHSPRFNSVVNIALAHPTLDKQTKERFMKALLGTIAVAATVLTTIAFIPQQANAERVCRQECVGPVCKETCVESRDRDRDRDQIRTDGRDDRRERREDSRDRNPGVELRAPGVGVEIGR